MLCIYIAEYIIYYSEADFSSLVFTFESNKFLEYAWMYSFYYINKYLIGIIFWEDINFVGFKISLKNMTFSNSEKIYHPFFRDILIRGTQVRCQMSMLPFKNSKFLPFLYVEDPQTKKLHSYSESRCHIQFNDTFRSSL